MNAVRWKTPGVMAAMLIAAGAPAASAPPAVPEFGARLEKFGYPFAVETMAVTIVGEPAEMAFMDIAPATPNGRTIVLLHGKNFCGATWGGTAQTLVAAGYRVIVPDQIGFCKSSKPRAAQYSFAMLASLTNKLLESRGVMRATIVGHSMGGMLAMRYAIMFPKAVEQLVLVNPLGLRDRTEDGLPYAGIETLWANERKTDYAAIKAYQQANYYHGTWQPRYDRWVWMLAGMYQGTARDQVALAQAKTSAMIYAQPVAHELYRIAVPTTLIVGTLDETAFGRARVPESLQKFVQPIPRVAVAAARQIPNARLVPLDGLGHSPQVEDPARFERTLLATLKERSAVP